MKTNRFAIPITLFISLILMLGAENIFGQGRSNRGRNENSISNTSGRSSRIVNSPSTDRVSYSNSRNERTSYNYSRNGSSNQTGSNIYEYTPGNTQTQVHNNNFQSHPVSGTKHQYVKHNVHHTYVNTYSYHHPKTYYTWHYPAPWKYASHAIVFHHNHGNYFYHHGGFYQYHPAKGYYRVGVPTGMVFEYLPVGYKRVYIGGQLYYRYGDIYFEYSPWGYRIVPHPVGIVITAHF